MDFDKLDLSTATDCRGCGMIDFKALETFIRAANLKGFRRSTALPR
jgi:hypothetical protein